MRFCPQLLSPLNVSGTLNRLNFLYRPPPVCSPARASRRAHRNGNTVVLAWGEEEEKKKGGPGDVTKSLWRNILLIHVRLYNLAHFYSERPRAQRSVEHASAVAERAARRHRRSSLPNHLSPPFPTARTLRRLSFLLDIKKRTEIKKVTFRPFSLLSL